MRIATDNIPTIKNELRKVGIINETLINAILAVIGKESNFKPQTENLKYTAARIRQVWPYIDEQTANKLANNPVALGNYVYGGKYGNIDPNDGFKFRGRGYNQITFRDQYRKFMGLLGIDFINNPDLMNDPETAAKVNALFFKNALNANKSLIMKKYGIDITKPIPPGTNAQTILRLAVNANAGFGKSDTIVDNEFQKALFYFDKLREKPNFIPGIVIAGLLIGLYFTLK